MPSEAEYTPSPQDQKVHKKGEQTHSLEVKWQGFRFEIRDRNYPAFRISGKLQDWVHGQERLRKSVGFVLMGGCCCDIQRDTTPSVLGLRQFLRQQTRLAVPDIQLPSGCLINMSISGRHLIFRCYDHIEFWIAYELPDEILDAFLRWLEEEAKTLKRRQVEGTDRVMRSDIAAVLREAPGSFPGDKSNRVSRKRKGM